MLCVTFHITTLFANHINNKNNTSTIRYKSKDSRRCFNYDVDQTYKALKSDSKEIKPHI